MAVLLDTCAVIYLATGARMAPSAKNAIAEAMRIGAALVSVVSAWEIGLLARPGRRSSTLFLPDADTWWRTFAAGQGVREIELTSAHAIAASNLPGDLHGDPADRLLAATARALGLSLVTRDKPLLDYARQGHIGAIRC